MAQRKFSNRIKRFFFILFIFFILFLISEILLKLFYLKAGPTIIYHNLYGWINKPFSCGAKFTGSKINFFSYDKNGFRKTKEQPKNKKQKIYIIGDSIVDGREVDDNSHIQNILRKIYEKSEYDIFTYGVSGWGTDQEYLFIKSLLNQDTTISIIVLAFYTGNDFQNNVKTHYKTFGKIYYKPYFDLQNDSLILYNNPVPREKLFFGFNFLKNYSSLYKFSNEIIFPTFLKIISAKNNNNDNFYKTNEFKKSLKITSTLLLDLKNNLTMLNKKFFVLIIPSYNEMNTMKESEYLKEIKNICFQNQIQNINFYNEFMKESKTPAQEFYLHFDGHLNEKGHLFIAKIIKVFFEKCR